MVHNLRAMDPAFEERGFDWAQRFDRDARALFTEAPGSLLDLERHADFAKAVPTPDHFLPSVFLAGLATAGGETLDVLVEGCAYGSLSMTSYGLGVRPSPSPAGAADDAGSLPVDVPLSGSNL